MNGRTQKKAPTGGAFFALTREDADTLSRLRSAETGLALLGRLLRCLLSCLLRHVTCPPLRQGPFVLLRSRVLRSESLAACSVPSALWPDAPDTSALDALAAGPLPAWPRTGA